MTLEGDPTVFKYLTPKFSPATPAGALRYEYLRDGAVVAAPHTGPYGAYQPQPEDFGARISVRVTATVDGQEPVVITSAETGPVLGHLDPYTGGSGEPIVGTAIGVSADASGWPALQVPAARTVTWFRDGQMIPGATAWQYTVTEADLGAVLSATADFTAPGYQTASASVSFGKAFRGYLNLATEPVITYATGTAPALPGTVLKSSSPAVKEPAPAGMTYAYQWGYSTFAGSSTWIEPIAGATADSYTVRPEDIGKDVRVKVTPVAAGYTGVATSSPYNTATHVLGRFTAPAAPGITGTAIAGQVLTALPGAAPSPAPESVQYLWYRDGLRLTGFTTDPTYRLTTADGGHKITVRAFYDKADYVQAASPESTAALPPGYFTPSMAVISGSAVTGYVLSGRLYYATPSPSTSLYQWYRDGKPISGATGASYRLTTADRWHQITVTITLKRAGTVTATVTSRAVRPLAVFTKLPTPVVRGIYAAGQVLRASTASSTPVPTSVTWQWQRDGKPIAGATGATYKLTLSDRDRFVGVVATYKKLNYLSASRVSGQRWVPGPTTVY